MEYGNSGRYKLGASESSQIVSMLDSGLKHLSGLFTFGLACVCTPKKKTLFFLRGGYGFT